MYDNIDGPSVVTAMTEIYADPRWEHDFDIVWDLTNVKELHFEWEDYEEWLDLHKDLADHVANGRCLILVSSPLHEAILKTYGQLARRSPRPVSVFRARDELERALAQKPC
jgi:hypothetical protein